MGFIAGIWAIIGITAILGIGAYVLIGIAFEAFAQPMAWHHWFWTLMLVNLMLVAKGYLGFQRRFSPQFAARLRYARNNPTLLNVLLAPAFCMGFFHAERRKLLTAWGMLALIFVAAQFIGLLPQPWRGIIDFGVAHGLLYGLLATLFYSWRALQESDFAHSPRLPGA